MGAISKCIRDLDPGTEVEAQLKETLGILVKLAESKLANYKLEMDNSWEKGGDESLAPGVTKDFQDEQMHVMTSTDNEALKGSIGQIVDAAFSLGKDVNGQAVGNFIKTLAQQGVDLVLGSGSAEENEHKQYIIYPDGEFLCRCDVWYWRYSMQSKGFQNKLQHVVVYRMQYGAVDVTRVDPIALAHWYNKWGLQTDDAMKVLDEAKALIANAKKAQPSINTQAMAEKTKDTSAAITAGRGELMKARNLL